jgi:hypothetical protein
LAESFSLAESFEEAVSAAETEHLKKAQKQAAKSGAADLMRKLNLDKLIGAFSVNDMVGSMLEQIRAIIPGVPTLLSIADYDNGNASISVFGVPVSPDMTLMFVTTKMKSPNHSTSISTSSILVPIGMSQISANLRAYSSETRPKTAGLLSDVVAIADKVEAAVVRGEVDDSDDSNESDDSGEGPVAQAKPRRGRPRKKK